MAQGQRIVSDYPLASEPLTPLEDIVLAVLQVRGTAKRAQQVVDTLQAWYSGQSQLGIDDVRWILRDLELWKGRVESTRRGGWYRALPPKP